MQRDPRAYLWDVREAADAIAAFVFDIDLAAYAANPMLHSRSSGSSKSSVKR